MSKRTGRLSLRMTEDFLTLCAKTARDRGLTLTEFTQQALVLNIARSAQTFPKRADKEAV